jgi:RNA polymerase sigma-70 factor (ECF subfamily)
VAWPTVALAEDEFARELSTRGAPPHAADLYLAFACSRGVEGAHAAFEAALMTQVAGYLRPMNPSPAFVDEVRQLLREKLFVGPEPRIAQYSGRGPIGAWLRVMALRTAVNLQTRGERGGPSLDPDRVAAGGGPELDYLQERYRPLVKHAFQEGLAALTSEQRNLLRLHLVDGLTLEEIGRLFSVNRSTVFRWLDAARAELLRHTRHCLHKRLGVDASEFDSLVQAVRSRLDLSLASILRTKE